MVHVVLVIVSLVMGTAIGWLGWKGLKAQRSASEQVKAENQSAERHPQGV